MITGNAAWTTALNAESKRPLYVFNIPGKNIALGSFFPLTLITGGSALLPILNIPTGASQAIDELTAHSSISTMDITAVDPSGALKTLSADASTIGQACTLQMGFPGLALTDVVTIHSGTVTAVSRETGGLMRITVSDRLLILVNDIFLSGGPTPWVPGQAKVAPPAKPPAVLGNGQPVSDANPRYLAGNAMDLLLAVLQNELGFGQITPPALIVTASGGSGTGQVGFGINPAWRFYNVSDPTTLINPNSYVDVPGILALRDGQFSGDRMEFTLTSPVGGKTWIEDQILKPKGLYWITRADGKLALKSMKHPASVASTAISDRQILGIPDIARWPVINMVQAELPLHSSDVQDRGGLAFVQQTSLNTYRSPFVHTISADGLRFGNGASTQLFLLANRIFNRHAFGTPVYTVRTFLKNFVIELGDFVSLTHPKLLNLKTGTLGITSVLCEIIDRQPDYANGMVTFKMIDTRFLSVSTGAYQIAAVGAGIPVWGSASAGQKAQYMFVSDRTGLMSDGTPGNPIQ